MEKRIIGIEQKLTEVEKDLEKRNQAASMRREKEREKEKQVRVEASILELRCGA